MAPGAGAKKLYMNSFILNAMERVDNVIVIVQASKIKLREVTCLVRVLIPGKHIAPSQIFHFSFPQIRVKCMLDAKHIIAC